MKKVIITAKVHPVLPESLTDAGYDVCYEPNITYDELKVKIADAHGLVVTTKLKIDAAMLDAAPALKWIGRLGSGLELIDTVYAESKGIKCMSTPEGNCTAVGEHALGMLLAFQNKLVKAVNEVRNHIWLRDENRGMEITGKTIGIIGFGHTGNAFAKVLSGFDVRILAHDKYKSGFARDNIKEASLNQVCAEADVISLHLPLTSETKHYANDLFFSQLKNKPVLVNTSRGKIVDTKALITALGSGMISGAALDVLENEKIDQLDDKEKIMFNDLCRHENVLLTPHIAGYSHEAYYKMSKYLLDKLKIPARPQ